MASSVRMLARRLPSYRREGAALLLRTSQQRSARLRSSIVWNQYRGFSLAAGYRFAGAGSYEDVWPLVGTNMILNVVPQGECFVVERLGKLRDIKVGGWFLAIPYVDRIAYRIDTRERAMAIAPQSAITKDNVSVDVSGILYIQFEDPERAAYGNNNPLYAVRQCAQATMRSSLGELELDEVLHARTKLNEMICSRVQQAATPWGMKIIRYEITDVKPDRTITIAMDKQAAAERNRREVVIKAEGQKRAQELQSEGVKLQLQNESEGELIKMKNEAEARRQQYILEGEGEAQAIRLRAQAYAEAINVVANALCSDKGMDAARIQIAKEYIQMYGLMGSQSNTMLFSDRPGDVNALIAQAAMVVQQASSPGTTPPTNRSFIPTSATQFGGPGPSARPPLAPPSKPAPEPEASLSHATTVPDSEEEKEEEEGEDAEKGAPRNKKAGFKLRKY